MPNFICFYKFHMNMHKCVAVETACAMHRGTARNSFMEGPIAQRKVQTDIESKGYSPQKHCQVISMVLEKTDRCKKYWVDLQGYLILTKTLILQMTVAEVRLACCQ